MLRTRWTALITVTIVASLIAATPHADENPSTSEGGTRMTGKELFPILTGRWKGTCRTWFEPGKLADESTVEGEFTPVFGGRFLKHTYKGSMMGKPRTGEDLLAFNPITEQWESAWVDDFHMNYAILFSVGPADEKGFKVRGNYDWKKGEPQGGWRTEFVLDGHDKLTITAFNIMPDGSESKGVETVYERVQ